MWVNTEIKELVDQQMIDAKKGKKKKTKETRKIKMEGTRTDLRDLREWNGAEKM